MSSVTVLAKIIRNEEKSFSNDFHYLCHVKRHLHIVILLVGLVMLAGCNKQQREARRMMALAEALSDTAPDSTVRLIDSVLRMPVNFSERRRMDMALLQGEVLFRDVELDDDFDFLDSVATSPELERAAAYYAKKKQYAKAAHAALYSGYVQQHYNEKEAAMRSFKEAEQYGKMVDDSLTVALAEYRMGKMLYDDYLETEAISVLKKADINFGSRLGERAYVHNLEAAVYMVLKQFDYAEKCLKESLDYAEQGQSIKAKRKAQNNFSVLYRQIGNYTQAKTCLMGILNDSDLTVEEEFLLYLNLGKTFVSNGEIDSAKLCFHRVERMIPNADVKDEAKISAFGALSRFAESQGDDSLSLKYRESHDNLMYEVMRRSQKQSVFRIQRQYDYESLQNEMNRRIIQRHRIILIISILLLVSFIIIIALQYRQSCLLKEEKEMKQQINALKHDLQKRANTQISEREVSLQLKTILVAYRISQRAKDPKKEWKSLVMLIMNGKDEPFEAARGVMETAYPNLYSTILEKYPDLTETEIKVCLLSCSDLSNAEIAEFLELRINTVNQTRSNLRKKLNLKSSKMKEQLRDRLSR